MKLLFFIYFVPNPIQQFLLSFITRSLFSCLDWFIILTCQRPVYFTVFFSFRISADKHLLSWSNAKCLLSAKYDSFVLGVFFYFIHIFAFTSIVYCRIFILHADIVWFFILYNLTWWIFFELRTIRESLSFLRCRLFKHIDDCSAAVAFIPFLFSASFLTSVLTISGNVVDTYIFTFLQAVRLLIMPPCRAYFANLIFGYQGNLYVLLAFNSYCIPLRSWVKSV